VSISLENIIRKLRTLDIQVFNPREDGSSRLDQGTHFVENFLSVEEV
jgi:hypothetical protein